MADEKLEAQRQTSPGNGGRRARKILLPILLLIVVAALVFLYWYFYLRGFVSTDDAVIDCDAITISSKMLGRIVTLNADEGDSVEAGELLVKIDDSDLKAQEAQAQASLDFVQEDVKVAKIQQDRARDDFERDSVQFMNHVVTREQYDHSRKALELAQAEQAVALSHVKASRANLAVIETQLNNTQIVAPTVGVVARKWVVPGDIVQPGQPIFTLFDLNDVWVTANFEETKLSSLQPGDSVEISVDAVPGRKFTGRVKMLGAAAASQFSLIPPNNASGNFTKVTQRVPIKIVFTDLENDPPAKRPPLLPGMSVEVKVRSSEK